MNLVDEKCWNSLKDPRHIFSGSPFIDLHRYITIGIIKTIKINKKHKFKQIYKNKKCIQLFKYWIYENINIIENMCEISFASILAKKSNKRIVEFLLNKSIFNINSNIIDNLFIYSVTSNNFKLFKQLYDDDRCDITYCDNVVINLSIKYNNIKILKILLHRLNPGVNNNEPFKIAVKYGNYDIVRLLLNDSRVYPSDNRNEALIEAITNGYYRIVLLLLNNSKINLNNIQYSSHILIVANTINHKNINKLLMNDPRFNINLLYHQ